MPPEIDDRKSPPEQALAPVNIDILSYHQAAAPLDRSQARQGQSSIEMSDPFGHHQGLRSLERVLSSRTESSASAGSAKAKPETGAEPKEQDKGKSSKPDNVICENGVCRIMTPAEMAARAKKGEGGKTEEKKIDFLLPPDAGQNKIKFIPGLTNRSSDVSSPKEAAPLVDGSHLLPSPFKPAGQPEAKDIKPAPAEPGKFAPPSDSRALNIPKPDDSAIRTPASPLPSSLVGKSVVVEAYERRQGARQAGNNSNLPPLDAIPMPSPRPDLTPPLPSPNNKPSDFAPWAPPKVDPNVRPTDYQRPNPNDLIPPSPQDFNRPGPSNPGDFRPVNPGEHRKPSPSDFMQNPRDFRPPSDIKAPSDLISKIEPKYETNDVATAVKMARDTGLPLAVHIGASWCHYCVEMEQKAWPSVEGSNGRKGSMQGKVVVLHLDVDQQRSLRGESAQMAAEITRNRGGSVPIIRVFSVDQSGRLTKTAENSGAIMDKRALENFLIRGGAKR
ncbi:MAG: thioredoxin family protein [Candidatus Obscuribacterales bacterium]|nr:thioredoxin family protein [Candidatus Obscuribacterales bacterium]